MRKSFIWSAPICVLATVLALTAPGTATASVTRPASQPAYTTFPGRLYGVVAVSARDVWAVGLRPNSSLIVHWNGTIWTRVPSPNPPGSSNSVLQSVTAVSSGNVWAVGYATIGGYSKTLAMHWDGRHWTLVPSPTTLGNGSFQTVAASWTHNIWAVGTTDYASTLIAHWNGTSWS